MAIEISPSDEQEPEEQPETEASTELQPVPPQDSPTQFFEWALKREQVRLRKVIWFVAIFSALSLLITGVMAYFLWDTRNDLEPRVLIQEGGASQESVDQLQREVTALNERIDGLAGDGGVSEEALASVQADVERISRQLATQNRQTTAAIECLDGAIAALDEAVRDLLRQDISANEFVQRAAINCG